MAPGRDNRVLMAPGRANGVLTGLSEWLPGVRLRHSVPLVQYIQRIVRAGGCPSVVAQWQNTGGSSQVSWV